MNSLLLNSCLAILIAGFVQFVSAVYRPGEYSICLSCPPVSHPHDCTTFVEIWSHERCSIVLRLLQNGSTVYKFGYEAATECVHTDSPAPPPVRHRRMSVTDIPICHECCAGSLCNRNLCGIPQSNNSNLACLLGSEVSGLPLDTSITYCNAGEQCYAGRLLHHPRPNQLNYGCASQVICDHLLMGLPDDGSSTPCQACCSQDGCNAHICHSNVPDPQETTASAVETTQSGTIFTDCWDLRNRGGFTEDGPYDIYPAPGHSRLRVRCDMTTDGGGWVILQRRYDGSLNFTQTHQEYEEGFGDVNGEHWLGLNWMHVLTPQGEVQLRVDLCTFNGTAGFAVYDDFSVSGQSAYRLHTGRYRPGSSLVEYLTQHNGERFHAAGYCAESYRGGWWYAGCGPVHLNGGRYNGGEYQGIVWVNFGSDSFCCPSLRSSEMKIRPVNATGDSSRAYTCPT